MIRKKLTLLEQAEAYQKELLLKERFSKVDKIKSRSDLLEVLLPNYKPLPKQLLFHKSKAFEKGIKGGYGSGKTMALCAEAIVLAYINAPVPVLLVSQSYDAALSVLSPTLQSLCDTNKLHYDFYPSKGEFIINIGGKNMTIWLAGGDEPKFLKGMNVASAGIDEPFVQKKETYEVVLSRVRDSKSVLLELFWAGTPEPTRMSWGHDYFLKESNSKDLFTITMPTRENINLSADYVKGLTKKFDSKMQEVYLEGKYLRLTSAESVYYAFDPKQHITNKNFIFDKYILSFDFNVNPMCAVLIGIKDNLRVQIDEFVLSKSNTSELCDLIIDKFLQSRYIPALIITGDASGRKTTSNSSGVSDYLIIKNKFDAAGIEHYISVPLQNPFVRDRVNYVNNLFEKNQFLINEKCKLSIKDRELVTWKPGGDKFIIDKSNPELTHLSDAADYGLWLSRRLINGLNDEYNQEQPIIYGRRRAIN